MKENKLRLSIIFRIGISLIPILFNMPLPAMIWCSFNIAISFIAFGPVTSIVGSLCAICFSMSFFSMYGEGAKLYGLFLSLEAILCAYAAIYTLVRRREFFSGVWLCAAGYLLPSVMSIRAQATKAGATVAQFLTGDVIEVFKVQMEEIVKNSGIAVDGDLVSKIADTVQRVTMAIVPSVLVIVSVIIGYIVMWCVTARLRMIPGSVRHSFSEIIIPRTMILFAIPTLVLYFVGLGDTVSAVTLNLFIIVMYLCFFSGLSFADFFLRKAIKATPIRVLVYIGAFMFLSSIIVMVITVVGILDSFFDFRKLRNRRQACETEE